MEILLNILWMVVALLAIANWRARRSHHDAAHTALALTCALLLLFPIISLSDDLHGSALYTEEAPAKRLVAGAGHVVQHVPAVVTAHFVAPAPAVAHVERVASTALPVPVLLVPRTDPRGPPSPARS